MARSLCQTAWRVLNQQNTEPPFDRAVPLPGLHPKDLETGVRMPPLRACQRRQVREHVRRQVRERNLRAHARTHACGGGRQDPRQPKGKQLECPSAGGRVNRGMFAQCSMVRPSQGCGSGSRHSVDERRAPWRRRTPWAHRAFSPRAGSGAGRAAGAAGLGRG